QDSAASKNADFKNFFILIKCLWNTFTISCSLHSECLMLSNSFQNQAVIHQFMDDKCRQKLTIAVTSRNFLLEVGFRKRGIHDQRITLNLVSALSIFCPLPIIEAGIRISIDLGDGVDGDINR